MLDDKRIRRPPPPPQQQEKEKIQLQSHQVRFFTTAKLSGWRPNKLISFTALWQIDDTSGVTLDEYVNL
jgi:hypothetical protein